MAYEPPIQRRYSQAFKRQVVHDIESGRFTLQQARKHYDIRGKSTIQSWLKQMGKNHLLAKVVRIQTPDDLDHLHQLEQQNRQLESALAQAHLRIVALESQLDEAIRLGQGQPAKKNV